jgi:hypothetical protein
VRRTEGDMSKTGPKPMPRFKCIADDCLNIADHPISGLCKTHYSRRKRTGKLTKTYRDAGSGTLTIYGYISHGSNKVKKLEHNLIVEKVLGKKLPPKAEVHHINGIRSDNRNCNLVVCPSRAYHFMLHVREKALNECGNADYRKCTYCKKYDDISNMFHNKQSRHYYHGSCKKEYKKELESRKLV